MWKLKPVCIGNITNNWKPLLTKGCMLPLQRVVQQEHAALDNWVTITNLLTTRTAGNHYFAPCIISALLTHVMKRPVLDTARRPSL